MHLGLIDGNRKRLGKHAMQFRKVSTDGAIPAWNNPQARGTPTSQPRVTYRPLSQAHREMIGFGDGRSLAMAVKAGGRGGV